MIHVIIPVYNRIDHTVKCINSLEKQAVKDKLNIIVVDDCSTDNTKNILIKQFPDVKILTGTGLLFWGGAVSYAIDHVLQNSKSNDWVLLVNNDVELSNNTISKLIEFSESNNRKVITGALTVDLNDKKTIIKSGTIVESWFFNKTRHIFNGLNINQLKNKEPIKVDFLTARCLLHPIEVFKIAGNYDSKNFLHYGGDDEFSMRVKKFDYSTFIHPKSLVYLNLNKQKNKIKLNYKRFLFVFFNIKSSSNILNKFRLSIKIVPFYAKLNFFLIGILKSLYIFFKI